MEREHRQEGGQEDHLGMSLAMIKESLGTGVGVRVVVHVGGAGVGRGRTPHTLTVAVAVRTLDSKSVSPLLSIPRRCQVFELG